MVTTVEQAVHERALASNFQCAGLARRIAMLIDEIGRSRLLASRGDAAYDIILLDSDREQ